MGFVLGLFEVCFWVRFWISLEAISGLFKIQVAIQKLWDKIENVVDILEYFRMFQDRGN